MALDVASPLLCSIEVGLFPSYEADSGDSSVGSDTSHLLGHQFAAERDDAVSRGRTLPCMCGSGVSPRRSPCLPRSASSSSETPSPWAFHHRYDRCCVPAVPPCMSEFGTSSDTMVLVVEHRGKRRQVELAGNCSVETLKETCLVGIPTIPTFSVCSSCAPSTPRSSTTDGSYVTTIYFPPRESRLPRFSI